MKASLAKYNAAEVEKLRHMVDELRTEIRRREADFSERIEALHLDMRERTEQRDVARQGMDDRHAEVVRTRAELALSREESATMQRLLSEAAKVHENNTRAFIAKCEEVGKWRERATMLATVVDGNVRESRMSLACLILDAKD